MIKKLLLLATVALAIGVPKLQGQTVAATPVPMTVPPPVASLPALPAPPLRPAIQPRRDQALINKLTPRVEIWRPNSNHPQVLARRSDHGKSDPAFVNGTNPVTIRLRFNPQAAGEQVTVIAARGILLNPPQQVLTISAQGDCTFQAQLTEGVSRGHLITYCKNVRTVVPLQRAPLKVVEAWEAGNGGQP
jgi:hypothetical protein